MPPTDLKTRATLLWAAFKRSTLFRGIQLFRLPGGSERVARGFSIGMVVNFFPTFGFGILVSGFVARLLGGKPLAGVLGGITLGFFWPALFYLNIRVGGLFHRSPIVVDELEDVTEKTVDTLVWGKTFMAGAVVNSLVVGLIAYAIVYYLHHTMRPRILTYFREHAKQTSLRRTRKVKRQQEKALANKS
jgi:uncharacterized protein (DUF2062 family)